MMLYDASRSLSRGESDLKLIVNVVLLTTYTCLYLRHPIVWTFEDRLVQRSDEGLLITRWVVRSSLRTPLLTSHSSPQFYPSVAFSQLWSKLFNKPEVKILILGLDSAGKSTILYKITMGEVVVTAPTVGSNVEVRMYPVRETKGWYPHAYGIQVYTYKNMRFVMTDV